MPPARFLFILLIILSLTACQSDHSILDFFGSHTPAQQASVSIHLCPEEDCAGILSEMISASNKPKCAFYSLSEPRVVSALEGSGASLVLDDDVKLDFAGSVKGLPDHTMHNKFCTINNSIVITGSYNPSKAKNIDLLIVINSSILNKAYDNEFKEMYLGDFGFGSKTEKASAPLGNGSIIARFCPDDPCQDLVVQEINFAKSEIFFEAYSFTSKDVADALIRASKRGVTISGTTDKSQESQFSQTDYLIASGIPVNIYRGSDLMHRKLFIIDNSTIITGSANPTKSGYFVNDENIIIIHDPATAIDLQRKLDEEVLQSSPQQSVNSDSRQDPKLFDLTEGEA